jgi:hypothetical protein
VSSTSRSACSSSSRPRASRHRLPEPRPSMAAASRHPRWRDDLGWRNRRHAPQHRARHGRHSTSACTWGMPNAVLIRVVQSPPARCRP